LLEHESIDDAAVIGVYVEQEETEYPTAYVVLKQNVPRSDNLRKEIKDFVDQQVADYKKLRGGVSFIDQIPRNSSSKILRDKLKPHCHIYTSRNSPIQPKIG